MARDPLYPMMGLPKDMIELVSQITGIANEGAYPQIAMVEALGAKATPMNYAEVFQGLQTGIVDGAENDFVSYYTSGHYEVAKYYSLDQHMAPPAILLMSKSSWDMMSAEQQEAVMKAAYEAAVWQRQAMQDFQPFQFEPLEGRG